MCKLLSSGLFVLSGFLSSSNIYAATDIEEVVVTAGFRESALMQSAGSISVLAEQRIYDRAAYQLSDLLNAIPNVNYSAGGSRARFIQVRGIGDIEQFVDPKHYPSVGILTDGIEIGTTANGAVLSDVKQVEILRGPQGTKFGANALAGIINIETNDPGDTLNGNVRAGYGNRNSWLINAAAGGPLTDNLGGRIAIQQLKSDGFIENDFLNVNDTNNIEELSLHGKLVWEAYRDNAIRLTGSYLHLDNGYDAFTLDNTRTTLTDEPGKDAQQRLALGAKASYSLTENIVLENQLSWSKADESYGFDEDWVFAGFCETLSCPSGEFVGKDHILRDRNILSFDTRLQSEFAELFWVAGIYLQARDEAVLRERAGSFSSDYNSKRYAAYGQLQYAFAKAWNLTTGIRVEHFRDRYKDSHLLDTHSTATYWSGEITLEYLHRDNTLLYATVARGIKPGGVNTDTRSNQPSIAASFQLFLADRLRFAAETLLNKEMGIKGHYFDERLALRLALFHIDRENAQLENWVFDASSFIWTGLLDSNSDAENYGAELELNYQLTDTISAFTHLSYLETNVEELTTFDLTLSQFVIAKGRAQAKAPNWQYSIGLEFDVRENLHGRIEVEGRDSSFFGYYHDGRLDSFTLAHASVSYQIGNIRIQSWVRNIFDEDYTVHGLFFANDPRDGFANNQSYFQFGEPRAYGVTANYSF